MISEKELQRMYRRFNRKYFYDLCPKKIKIEFVDKILIPGTMGGTYLDPKTNEYTIELIRPLQNLDTICWFTLLHEMVHVYLPWDWDQVKDPDHDHHGKEFQDEMKRLALMNAFQDYW